MGTRQLRIPKASGCLALCVAIFCLTVRCCGISFADDRAFVHDTNLSPSDFLDSDRKFWDLSMPHLDHNEFTSESEESRFEWLPTGLIYRSYLAGEKEPRMGCRMLYDLIDKRVVTEACLGGRVGLLRYGGRDERGPTGYQLDFEGAVQTRLLPEEPSTMMEGADFRFGLLNTWRSGNMTYKAGYYHISSHLGDEFLIEFPDFPRLNYVRDAAIFGTMVDLSDDWQGYGEVAYAVGTSGGAKPLELQFGTQWAPVGQGSGAGAPYAGINTMMRQDFRFRGSMNVECGWNCMGRSNGSKLKVGVQYYRGPSLQFSFYDKLERLVGGGLTYDF
ncbi:DUF1207 domain-containing protein [Pirellulaceae bacterium SH449]